MIVHFGSPASQSNTVRLRTLSKKEISKKVSFFVFRNLCYGEFFERRMKAMPGSATVQMAKHMSFPCEKYP